MAPEASRTLQRIADGRVDATHLDDQSHHLRHHPLGVVHSRCLTTLNESVEHGPVLCKHRAVLSRQFSAVSCESVERVFSLSYQLSAGRASHRFRALVCVLRTEPVSNENAAKMAGSALAEHQLTA